MRGLHICTNLITIFFTHYFTRASWPSSPNLGTFLPQFGHVCQARFSHVFLTELFCHISYGYFHYTCSKDQCFSRKEEAVKSFATAQLCSQYLVEDFAAPALFNFWGIDNNYFFQRLTCTGYWIVCGDPLLLHRRPKVMDAYMQLRQNHPALPPNLRDFQVCCP